MGRLPIHAQPVALAASLLASAALLFGCTSADKDIAPGDLGRSPLKGVDDSFVAPISIPEVTSDDWRLSVAYRGDIRINGVACGDLIPEAAGDEIVTVDRLGRIRMHRLLARSERTADATFTEIDLPRIPVVGGDAAGSAAGELVQVAIGDLAPGIPGDEIVAVGMAEGGEDDGGAGAIRVYARSGAGGSWVEHRFVTPALVHAVAIGDLVADRAGNEFLAAGFFGEALIGQLDVVGGAATLSVRGANMQHRGNAKGACLTDRGCVLACDDGSLMQYHADANGDWTLYDEVNLGAPLARVAAYPTGEIAVCGNDGTFRLIEDAPPEDTPEQNFMVRSDNRLRGAVVADLDPDHFGIETATAGYDGLIRVIRLSEVTVPGSSKRAVATVDEIIARDTAKLHHLTTGRFPGLSSRKVPSLVSCGYSGEVLVLSRRD